MKLFPFHPLALASSSLISLARTLSRVLFAKSLEHNKSSSSIIYMHVPAAAAASPACSYGLHASKSEKNFKHESYTGTHTHTRKVVKVGKMNELNVQFQFLSLYERERESLSMCKMNEWEEGTLWGYRSVYEVEGEETLVLLNGYKRMK
jgi:hypothetical protein